MQTKRIQRHTPEGFHIHYKQVKLCVPLCAGSPVSAQPVIMAAPHHPSILPSGVGKALALVPGGGQPIHLLQNPNQSLTMVRVVTSGPLTSNPPNGYSNPSAGGGDGNSELRGTAM